MARGWRYFATRLNGDGTETLLDPDLPLTDVSFTNVVSGHNDLNGQIDPAYARLRKDGQPILREWSTAIYAENGGDIRGAGILVNTGIDGPNLDLECIGFTGYLKDLPYIGLGYKGVGVDPIGVVRTIWNHAQFQRGGNLNVSQDMTTTGGKVKIGLAMKQGEFDTESGPLTYESGPYQMNWYSTHDLASNVDDLAAATPFDYRETHRWKTDGTIRHHIELGYPSLGFPRIDLRFMLGVNVFAPLSLSRDGDTYADETLVLGAGEGASMVHAVRVAPGQSGRLRRVAVVTDDTIRSVSRAAARANEENQWRRRIDEIDTLVVHDHPNAPLGSVQPGDQVRLEGKSEWVDVDTWMRVLSITTNPEEGTQEFEVVRTDMLES